MLKPLLSLYNTKAYRPLFNVAFFSVITVVFHWIWWHGLVHFLAGFGWFESFREMMVYAVFSQSAWIDEHIFGMEIVRQGTTLVFPGKGYVEIVESCSGTKQFYQILVLFLIIPGSWKHKAWYIPASMIVMHATNVFRILVLSGMVLHAPQHWDFVHDWIMRPFFYVVLFLLWVLWVEKFDKEKPAPATLSEKNG